MAMKPADHGRHARLGPWVRAFAAIVCLGLAGCAQPKAAGSPAAPYRFALRGQPSRPYLIWDMHPVADAGLHALVVRQLRAGPCIETRGGDAELLVAILVFRPDGRTRARTATVVLELLEPRSGASVWLGQAEVADPDLGDPQAGERAQAQVAALLRSIPWARALARS